MPNYKTLSLQAHRRNLILSCAAFTLISACGGGGSSEPSVTYSSVLSGSYEVPVVVSNGTGSGTATLVTSTRALSGSVQLTNLTATKAHIHQGAIGATVAQSTIIVTLDNQPLAA